MNLNESIRKHELYFNKTYRVPTDNNNNNSSLCKIKINKIYLLLDSIIRNSVCTPAKFPCRRVEVGYE
jgi:hypothetical protein